jgi:hypothetical protein
VNRKRMHMNLNKSKLKLRSGGEQGVRGEKRKAMECLREECLILITCTTLVTSVGSNKN